MSAAFQPDAFQPNAYQIGRAAGGAPPAPKINPLAGLLVHAAAPVMPVQTMIVSR